MFIDFYIFLLIFIDVCVFGWLVVPALRRHPTTKGTTNVHIAVSEVQFSLFSNGKLILTPSRSMYNSIAHARPYILEEAKSVIRIAFLVGWWCLPCIAHIRPKARPTPVLRSPRCNYYCFYNGNRLFIPSAQGTTQLLLHDPVFSKKPKV